MESDGDDSDDVARKLKEDEFELPRVMWVPDKAENQEDFLRKNKPHNSFRPAPCTQTTESSRLLRDSLREVYQRNDSITSMSSTGTATFPPGVLDSTPSGRRPTRRIRSLPSPYSTSCSNTNSSRRSTVSGASSSRTESAPLSTTSARHLDVSNTSLATVQSNMGSPGTDSLGSLMTQLGERFSRRNEARKKRAEMQEKVKSGREQIDMTRIQQMEEERRKGSAQLGNVTAQQSRNAAAFDQRNQSSTKQFLDPHSSRQTVPSIKINSGSSSEIPTDRQRYPLAKGDANQHTNATTPAICTSDASSVQKRQKIGQSPFVDAGAAKGIQKTIAIQQNNIHFAHKQQNLQHQSFPAKSANQNNPVSRLVNPVNHAASARRQQPSISLPTSTTAQTSTIVEADNDIGQHHKSDTSFESLNDMDGLFSGGGEEVEALFRACDGF